MKAAIGALLVSLSCVSTGWAQSPAFNRTTPAISTNAFPPPALPGLPSVTNAPLATGAQFPTLAAPPPSIPTLPTPSPADGKTWQPPTPAALNAPYAEPFLPPSHDAAFPVDAPNLMGGSGCPLRIWMSADYLMWWVKRAPQSDPLVVSGSPADAFPGALDQPNTSVLYGGKGLGFNTHSGLRLSVGTWFGADNRFGLEVSGWILDQVSNQFRSAGDATGTPFLARPFINALTGNENVYFVSQNFADPTITALMRGGIDISSSSRIWSWETNALWNFQRGASSSHSLIAGFRSITVLESLHISEALQNLDPAGGVSFRGLPVDPSQRVLTFDRFDTHNTFYGGQLGMRSHYQRGALSVDVTGKCGLGDMQQLVIINGLTALDGPNGKTADSVAGGVLAQTSNIGRHFRNHFGVVPEGSIDLSYTLFENLVFKLGYNFVYINSVVRPGALIDRTINPNLVPTDAGYGTPGGPSRPGFQFHTSGIWAQGINLGIELRF